MAASACAAPTAPAPGSGGAGPARASPTSTTTAGGSTSGGAGADRRAGHPAGLAGRVDLPVPARAPAGHGHRCRGSQAVPLPRRLARAPRRGEVRRHGPLRRRAAQAAPRGGRPRGVRGARPARACWRAPCACWRAASSASAPRSTRSRTSPTASRPCAGRTSASSRAARWSSATRPRAASGACRASSTSRRAPSSPRSSGAGAAARAAGLQGRAAAGTTCARRTSTPTSRRPPAGTSRPRTSARGTPRSWPPWRSAWPARWRHEDRPQAAVKRAIDEVATYLGNTPAVCRASYIDPRVFDAYQAGLTIRPRRATVAERMQPGDAAHPPPALEAAVLDLLDERGIRRAGAGRGVAQARGLAPAPPRWPARQPAQRRAGGDAVDDDREQHGGDAVQTTSSLLGRAERARPRRSTAR